MASVDELRRKFPYVVLHGVRLGSFGGFITDQLIDADNQDAPHNAVYFCRDGKRWHTTDDIENERLILEWQLSCVECGGQRAKRKGCSNYRHGVYEKDALRQRMYA